jgi:hypothetical protein
VGREAIANFSRAELPDDCSGIFWILEGILSEESEVEAGLRKSDSCAKALDTPRDLVGAKFCRTVGNDGSCSVSENDWTTGWFTGVVPSATDSTGTGSEGAAITLWGLGAIALIPVAGSFVARLENAWTTGSWAGVVSTGILWILVDSPLSDSAEDAPRGKSDC